MRDAKKIFPILYWIHIKFNTKLPPLLTAALKEKRLKVSLLSSSSASVLISFLVSPALLHGYPPYCGVYHTLSHSIQYTISRHLCGSRCSVDSYHLLFQHVSSPLPCHEPPVENHCSEASWSRFISLFQAVSLCLHVCNFLFPVGEKPLVLLFCFVYFYKYI